MYSCPSCGGNVRFDIESQQMKCPYCSNLYTIEEMDSRMEEDAKETELFDVTVFTCPQCGGELYSSDTDATSFCPYCGGADILSSRLAKEKKPDKIIPFKITKDVCKKNYLAKMKESFYVPKEMKEEARIESFRGIYMPYWTYRISQKGSFVCTGETKTTDIEDIIVRTYLCSGMLDTMYYGYSCDASTSFYDNISECLAPFDTKAFVDFTPAYLSGFYADIADVDSVIYEGFAKDYANRVTAAELKKDPLMREYHANVDANATNAKLHTTLTGTERTMFPVWFMSYRMMDERVAYAAVNGQTGKVVSDMPVDPKKYCLISLGVGFVLFLLLNLFLSLRSDRLIVLALVLAIISGLMYIRELKQILKRSRNEDDLGLLAKEEGYEAALKKSNENNHLRKSTSKKKNTLAGAIPIIIILVFVLFSLFSDAGISLGVLIRALAGSSLVSLAAAVAAVIVGMWGMAEYKRTEEGKGCLGYVLMLAASVCCILVTILSPASDMFYYAAGILTLVSVIVQMLDLIRNHNILMTRRLPQFDKKGGDDRA